MDFADEAVDACALVGSYVEERLQEVEVHELVLPLEVAAVVPLYDGVLQLTDSVGIAEDLENAIFDLPLFAVVAVCQDCILGRLGQHRWEPLDGIDVDHALHIEQIDGYLYGVSLAYLIYRLDVGPVDQLEYLLVVHELGGVRALELLELLLLLLLVLVHPENTRAVALHDVHFVVGAVLGRLLVLGLLDAHAALHAALLAIHREAHLLTAVREFVFEACFEAVVQMVVLRGLAERRGGLSLVKNLTDKDAVDTNASFSAEIHYARIGVASLEKQMFVVFIHKVDFDWVHSFIDAFEDQMVPIWTQSQKFAEVCHIVL